MTTWQHVVELQLAELSDPVRVVGLHFTQRIHEGPQARVTVRHLDEAGKALVLDPHALVGTPATLSLDPTGEHPTLWALQVAEVSIRPEKLEITLRHPLVMAATSTTHGVFLDQDGCTIAKDALSKLADAAGATVEERIDAAPEARPQRTLTTETTWDACRRLLAEEGIALTVEPKDGESSVVALADHAEAYPPIQGDSVLAYVATVDDGLLSGASVGDARIRHLAATDTITLRDFNLEKPALDLGVEQSRADAEGEGWETYTFCGNQRYGDPSVGKAVASKMGEATAAQTLVLEGQTTDTRLRAGATFELENAPRDELNQAWLVVELQSTLMGDVQGDGGLRYLAKLVAVPAANGYRPPAVAPAHAGSRRQRESDIRGDNAGMQTATVTGPSGEEIHTDAFGRVTAALRWEQERPQNETSSTWMRTLQPATSGGVQLPRVGWESVIAFQGAGEDHPYVLGRLDNGAAPPSESLPAGKAKGAFGTPSTPGGGGKNCFSMDDSKGSEGLSVLASFDYNETNASNKKVSVSGSGTTTIGANDVLESDGPRMRSVAAAQSISTGADYNLTAASGIAVQSGSETIVAAVRKVTSGGDYAITVDGPAVHSVGAAKVVIAIAGNNRHVTGASVVTVGGSVCQSSAMVAAVTVAGPSMVSAPACVVTSAKMTFKATGTTANVGAATITTGGRRTHKSAGVMNATLGAFVVNGKSVVMTASAMIVFRTGGYKITVTPGSIVVTGESKASGDFVNNGAKVAFK